jgi:hypothetical protein
MKTRTRIPRRSRRTMAPALDQLEARQLLSTAVMPVHGSVLAHHHQGMRVLHAAIVARAHSGHHGASPAAAPATTTGLQVVAQFNNSSFAATVAIADNDIWAVGGSTSTGTQQTLAVHFNGTSWSVVPTPSPSGRNSFLNGVAAVASKDVWAVGSTGSQTLIEHWNGTSWSVVSSPKLSQGGALTAVTAITSNNVWAVGFRDDFTGDVVEHWDGTSWSIVSSPAFTGASDILKGISADASNDVWAGGDSFSGGPAVILHFDGTNWSRVATPRFPQGFSSFNAVTALSPSNVWAVGIGKPDNRCCPRGLIEHWDGTKFSVVPSPDPKPNATLNLEGVAAVSTNNIWAVGTTGIENWNGTSWSIFSTSLGAAVTALSDGTVVVVSGGTILEN